MLRCYRGVNIIEMLNQYTNACKEDVTHASTAVAVTAYTLILKDITSCQHKWKGLSRAPVLPLSFLRKAVSWHTNGR